MKYHVYIYLKFTIQKYVNFKNYYILIKGNNYLLDNQLKLITIMLKYEEKIEIYSLRALKIFQLFLNEISLSIRCAI